MKNADKLNDAIGNIDHGFVAEYMEGAPKKRVGWAKWLAVAACFAVVVSAICIPFAQRKIPDKDGEGETSASVTGMVGLTPSSEILNDATGREVLHVTNAGMPDGIMVGMNSALEWSATSYCYITHDTPSLLAVKGVKVSSDSYSYKTEDEDGIVYDHICYVSGIAITEMLKQNNTSGYGVGDVIYVFDYLTGQMNEDGEMTYIFYKESCIPPEEEAVYLLTTNEGKTYIPTWAKEMGVIEEDVWNTTGVTSPERFDGIWKEVVENWEYFEENY